MFIIYVYGLPLSSFCAKEVAKCVNGLGKIAATCWLFTAAVLVYPPHVSNNWWERNYCVPMVYNFLWWCVTLCIGGVVLYLIEVIDKLLERVFKYVAAVLWE